MKRPSRQIHPISVGVQFDCHPEQAALAPRGIWASRAVCRGCCDTIRRVWLASLPNCTTTPISAAQCSLRFEIFKSLADGRQRIVSLFGVHVHTGTQVRGLATGAIHADFNFAPCVTRRSTGNVTQGVLIAGITH